MKFFLPKYPSFLKILYPERISKVKNSNAIYLSFDDGPVPEVTPWVLDLLDKHKAKATFFCIGDNVEKHTELFQSIIKKGHCIGNHTFNHLNGWNTSKNVYVQNSLKAEKTMSLASAKTCDPKLSPPNYPLFRPPYGRITNSQARLLKKSGYQIVMWDVISGDYDENISPENCFKNVTKNARPGSTIVFHDSLKASKNLRLILPKILEYYSEKGMKFRSLKDVL